FVFFRWETCNHLNFQSLFKKTPVIGKNPILNNLILKKSRPHQRRTKRSKDGNAKKQSGFWVEILDYIESKTKQYGRRTYDMESGVGDEDYVQRAMFHYEIDTGVAFKLHHCWEILKDRLKWQEVTLPKFSTGSGAQEKEERLAFLDIKRREVEYRERELEQQDMRFYLQPYDHLTGDQRKAMDEIWAKIKAKYNLQY
nr:hypothetical protein [Tanacetum cinerariifolium]